MKVLAIETSCEHASIALLSAGEVLERTLEGHANHSEKILAEIACLLADSGVAVGQLDALAFGSGPGAFTGLRLACGLVQGLALGSGVGIAAVSSLAALALQAPVGRVMAATDARMGEVYHCAFELRDGIPTARSEMGCCAPEQVLLPDGDWFAIGSAFAAYDADLTRRLSERWSGVAAAAVPRAGDVARLAARQAGDGLLLPPERAVPLYVRDKVALTTAERLARGGKA